MSGGGVEAAVATAYTTIWSKGTNVLVEESKDHRLHVAITSATVTDMNTGTKGHLGGESSAAKGLTCLLLGMKGVPLRMNIPRMNTT